MADRIKSTRSVSFAAISPLILVVVWGLAACGGADRRPDGPLFVELSDGQAAGSSELDAYAGAGLLTIAADIDVLRATLAESEAEVLTATYLSAEIDLLEGHFTRAFERFAEVVVAAPDSLVGALASTRAAHLGAIIGGFSERAETILDSLRGRRVNAITSVELNLLAIQHAWALHSRVSGDTALPFSAESLGLPDEWRRAGPFSRFPHLDLQRDEPFDADLILAEEYQLDGRRVVTKPILVSDIELGLGGVEAGTYVLESWMHLDASSTRIAVLDSHIGAQLSIDGCEVLVRTETGPYQPRRMSRPIRLSAGWHRVRLRVGWDASGQPVHVRFAPVTFGEPGLSTSAEPPTGVVMGEALPGGLSTPALEQILPAEVLEPTGPLEAYALLQLGSIYGHEELATRGLEFLAADGAVSPIVLMAAARFADNRASLAPVERQNLTLGLLRETVSVAPSAQGAVIPLAAILSSDGRGDEALRLLTELGDRLAGELILHIARAEMYSERGWDELAETALNDLLELEPTFCAAVEELTVLYDFRDHYPPIETLPEGFQTCESGLLFQIDHYLLPRGEIAASLTLLRQLSERKPADSYLQRRLIDLYMSQGWWEEARDQLELASRYAFDRRERATIETDLLLSRGLTDEALALVEQTLREEAPGDPTLHRTAALLQHERLLGDLRIDTLEAIQAYRDIGMNPRAEAIYALDYAAYRYFDDGSALAVTHQILHVLTREGLSNYGEVSIPGRAVPLRVRTIKADGTILEPDVIPGKETISMPNLEVGDFVEYEYLDVIGSSRVRADTVMGQRFYFEVFDAPLAISELVIETPAEWTALTFDLRGGAPEPEVLETDDLRRYRFLVTESTPPVEEPGAPSYDELMPSVRYAHGYSWDDVVGFYLDRRASTVRITPEIEVMAAALVEQSDGERDAIERIFRTVVDVFEEMGGFLSTDAQWTLTLGEGERLTLLLALLEAGGFDADLVFLRAWEDDQTDSPIPDSDSFPHTAVRVRHDDGEVWLRAGDDYAVFDYLPPEIQGTDGFVIGRSTGDPLEWLESPVWPDETNEHRIEMEITLDEAGDFTAVALETVPARSVASTRSYLERIQDMRSLIQDIEGGLSGTFSGVEVTAFEAEGAESVIGPLLLRYEFRGQRLAQIGENEIVIDSQIFDRRLRTALGSMPERTVPLVVGYPFAERLIVRFVLPSGFDFVEVPPNVQVQQPWLDYSWELVSGGIGSPDIELVRHTALHVGRISPDEYPGFLEALQQIERSEGLHLRATR